MNEIEEAEAFVKNIDVVASKIEVLNKNWDIMEEVMRNLGIDGEWKDISYPVLKCMAEYQTFLKGRIMMSKLKL